MTRARSLTVLVLAIFAVYIAMRSPESSANIIRDGLEILWTGLGNLWDFITTLFTGS